MAITQSTALRNHLLSGGSFRDAFNGGKIVVREGTKPASADDAPTGTLLVTYSDASGAVTEEVQATGTVTLDTGASGSVDTLTVNSIEIMGAVVPFNTTLTQTAADVAAQINLNKQNKLFTASSAGAVVTIKAKPGLGTLPNTWAVVTGVTTITKTDVNMASGVNSVNGLDFEAALGGSITKRTGQVWSGLCAASGTAGWFRLEGPIADTDAADTTPFNFMRLDGTVAVSGGDLNVSSINFTISTTETINTFTPTEPAA